MPAIRSLNLSDLTALVSTRQGQVPIQTKVNFFGLPSLVKGDAAYDLDDIAARTLELAQERRTNVEQFVRIEYLISRVNELYLMSDTQTKLSNIVTRAFVAFLAVANWLSALFFGMNSQKELARLNTEMPAIRISIAQEGNFIGLHPPDRPLTLAVPQTPVAVEPSNPTDRLRQILEMHRTEMAFYTGERLAALSQREWAYYSRERLIDIFHRVYANRA